MTQLVQAWTRATARMESGPKAQVGQTTSIVVRTAMGDDTNVATPPAVPSLRPAP